MPRETTSATMQRWQNCSAKIGSSFVIATRTETLTEAANPNGSRDNIAGICNRSRNVLGLMPHPERACEDLLGSSDGRDIFRSLAATLAAVALTHYLFLTTHTENPEMKHHPAWLAAGLLVFVVLACSFGNPTANSNSNANSNSTPARTLTSDPEPPSRKFTWPKTMAMAIRATRLIPSRRVIERSIALPR